MTGLVLGERYRLQQHCGEGATAEVFRATDLVLDRSVAIKILRRQYASDPQFRARFLEEARAAARLTHPNIVAVYDVGVSENGDTAYHYIVMELVEGPTLRDVIVKDAPLPPDRALAWTIQVLTALNYAHQRGLVHRDVKPANVLLTPDGQVKVADFGIAAAANTHQLGETGVVVGTALYLSPEQATGRPATESSDLYSVGVVLFEMLTGQVPFDGSTPVAVALQHVQATVPSARSLNPRVSPRLDAVLQQALAKNPAERLDAAAFARELQSYLRLGIEATSALPVASRQPTSTGSAPTSARSPRRRGPDWFTILVGLLVFVAFVGMLPLAASLYNVYMARPPLPPAATPASGQVDLPSPSPVLAPTPDLPVEASPTVQPSPTPPSVVVPNVVEKPIAEASKILDDLGLKVKVNVVSQTATPGQAEETVIGQQPAADAPAREGDTVELFVARAPDRVTVPPVVGRHRADAERLIRDAGLNATVNQEYSDRDVPAGWVIRQDPVSGQQVAPRSIVTIVVNMGPRPLTPTPSPTVTVPANTVVVPNVVGRHLGEAQQLIEDAGLRLNPPNYQSPEDVPPDQRDYVTRTGVGFVLSQQQQPGTRVPRNSGIDVAVRR